MSGNPNGDKGAATERMVAEYLRTWFFLAERRLKEGRQDDQGDIDGIPYTTVQVKYVESPRMGTWVQDTLRQQANAKTHYCLLVVRKKYHNVAEWDAYMPVRQAFRGDLILDEVEAWTWVRMDLRLAVVILQRLIGIQANVSPSGQSWSTTTSPYEVAVGQPSAPSMESGENLSPTT